MSNEEIRLLAEQQLSEETGIARMFVIMDLPEEFVDRCILIAQQQVKNNDLLHSVSGTVCEHENTSDEKLWVKVCNDCGEPIEIIE
jgi:hypothetical protein